MDVDRRQFSTSLPGYIDLAQVAAVKRSGLMLFESGVNFKTSAVVVSVTVVYCTHGMVRNEFLTNDQLWTSGTTLVRGLE